MVKKQFLTFYLDDSLWGINILLIREINRNLEITHVDGAPEFVHGLLNLRGQIVTVIDTGIQLGLGPRKIGKKSCCIILKAFSETAEIDDTGNYDDGACEDIAGLLVDDAGNVVTVDSEEIKTPPANVAGVEGKYISGVVKLENELMNVLDVKALLCLEREKVQNSVGG